MSWAGCAAELTWGWAWVAFSLRRPRLQATFAWEVGRRPIVLWSCRAAMADSPLCMSALGEHRPRRHRLVEAV